MLEIIASSLLSGFLAVIISIYYQSKSEERRIKLEVLRNFVGYRFELRGEKFTKALNEVFVVFQDSKDVLKKLKEFHEIIISGNKNQNLVNEKLYDLFKSMCKNLEINTNEYTKDSFLSAFNIKK